MKIQAYLTTTVAAVLLAAAPFAHADTPVRTQKHAHALKTAQTLRFSQPTYAEMAITRDQQLAAAQQQSGNDIGNNAPHEERNPAAHPELFQISR